MKHESPEEDALIAAYLDHRLTAEDRERLERLLREDGEFRSRCADALHLEGVMRAEAASLFADTGPVAEVRTFPASRRWLAAAALLALGLLVGWVIRPAEPSRVPTVEAPAPEESAVSAVATLADVKSAKWGAGSLPTREGARLEPGALELLEGLATLRFDSGVTVTLEAPAAVEIESPMRCRLRRGAAVAWVPEGAEGFQIETDDALLTDYGTRFGITAGTDGKSEVLVLEGEIGVTHRKGDGEKRLKTGEMVRYDAERLVETLVGEGESPRFGETPAVEPEGWRAVTTRQGRGKDTYARQGNGNGPFGASPLLMVKNSAEHVNNRRKAWLTFDLGNLDRETISDSELVLSVQPSGLGYASMVPDATFALYGLRDESSDAIWDEAELRWEDAPANVLDHGFQLDESKVVPLGEFIVEQGVSSGLRKVAGPALTDFLLGDTDGLVTFILVRLTDETGSHGLVHAFASAEHPAAMPPTLRVKVR